ncbi:MAG: protein kinase [Pirellulaceae bacterium]
MADQTMVEPDPNSIDAEQSGNKGNDQGTVNGGVHSEADVGDENLALSARALIRKVREHSGQSRAWNPVKTVCEIDTAKHAVPGVDPWPADEQESDSFSGVKVGTRIGKFEIREMLGHGGFGLVLLAYDAQLDRKVALKIPRLESLMSQDGRARFLREARAAALLGHPNIVPVYEAGQVGPTLFIAFEFVDGLPLNQWLSNQARPVDSKQAAHLMIALASAVQHAHSRGIVHRDLKPANVLLQASAESVLTDGKVLARCARITDFGMARISKEDGLTTQTGAVVGTPAYMSPEQVQRGTDAIGPATDVYGLGAILYELLTGKPPFEGSSIASVIRAVAQDDPVAPRRLQQNVSHDLEAICLKCLEKKPERRYVSAMALAEDLQRFLAGHPILARQDNFWEQGVKWAHRHPALAALMAVFLIGTVAVCWQWYRAESNRIVAESQTAAAEKAREAEQIERQRVEQVLYARNMTLAQHEYDLNYTTRARQLLDETPVRMRHWEYDFLRDQTGTVIWDFADLSIASRSVSISSNRKWIAASSSLWGKNRDCQTCVWDIENGTLRFVLNGHPSSVTDVQFSPDNRYIVTSGMVWRAEEPTGGKVNLWDAQTGNLIKEIMHDHVYAICFTPDGKYLAIGKTTGTTELYSIPDGQLIRKFEGHTHMILSMSVHPTGELLATASRDGSFRIWEIATGKSRFEVKGLVDVRSIDFSPNGIELALATFPGTVKVYRFFEDKLEEIASHEQSKTTYLRYSPDGQFLALGTLGKGCRFVDAHTGETIREFPGHNGDPLDMDFSRDGVLFATSGGDGNVRVWDLTRPVEPSTIRYAGPYLVDSDSVPDTRLMAVALGLNTSTNRNSQDRTAKLWDIDTNKFVRSFAGHDDWLTCVDVSNDGRHVASGSLDKTICVWNLETAELVHRLKGHESAINDIVFADQDQFLFSCGDDGTVRIWDVASGECRETVSFPDEALNRICVVPGRGLLAIGNRDGLIRIRSLKDNSNVARYRTEGSLKCLASSSNGKRIALANSQNNIEILDVDRLVAGEDPVGATISGHTDVIASLNFNSDGNRLVSASGDHTVKLWDLHSGQEVLRLTNDNYLTDAVAAFDGTGRSITLVADTVLCSWTCQTDEARERKGIERINQQQESTGWHQTELNRGTARRNWFAARFHADKLLQSDPTNVELRARRVSFLAELGEFDAATRDLETLLPETASANVLYRSAVLCLRNGDMQGYANACRKSVALLKDDSPVSLLNAVAWTCAIAPDAGIDLAPLISRIEPLMESGEGNFLNTLGALCYRHGDHEKAIRYLNKAVDKRVGKGIGFDWFFLALVHRAMEHPAEADEFARKFEAWLVPLLPLSNPTHQLDPQMYWEFRIEVQLFADELRKAGF